jgi:hypothetical protein
MKLGYWSGHVIRAFALLSCLSYSGLSVAEDLVLYSSLEKRKVTHLHNEKKDFGVGHHRHGTGELRFEKNGPDIGEYHVITSVLNVDKAGNTDTREYIGILRLPKGDIITQDTVEMEHVQVNAFKAGWSQEGVIVGGTRDYKGITGTFLTRVTEDDRDFETVIHLNE